MPNDDGNRSRPGRDGEHGKPGASDETRGDLAVGKQSLVDQEFGIVGPGTVVQRRGASHPASAAEMAPGKQSLVDATFGSPVGPGAFMPRHGARPSLVDATFGVLAPNRAGQAGDGDGRHPDGSPVQARTGSDGPPGAASEAGVHAAAAQGIATPSSRLPYRDTIQRLFGRHDISSVQAHTGAEAAGSARAMNADAYATGNHIVLGSRTDLHTAAHEAAHIVQQRGGVQLKGGVGAAGDAYEHHADAVADRVVAGRSAEDLLDTGATSGATSAVQRKETKDDAAILDNQAHLKNTDVEIPALEGALLATRLDAVKRGLLSKASFDAGLVLSQAMTQLQPAVAAHGAVDQGLQEKAAVAAQQLLTALRAETADEKNFHIVQSQGESPATTFENPYTQDSQVVAWPATFNVSSWFEQLPGLIRRGTWDEAFEGYRRMFDGLDLWVADQLRKKGKGTPEEARGDLHQHHAQLRTGLEQIAGKHATRLPALFHPDPKTVEEEKAAGRPVADTIPMNVYFWKDDKTGKVRLYDLTTPGRPQEQTIEGPLTATAMHTFFEEVARYPKGDVRYTLPDGASSASPTSGKTKWYEWVAYAGLVVAGVGLALAGGVGLGLLAGGASTLATVCFAGGALAGGVSAGGHLADTLHLGTATTTTVVIDVAQVVSSLSSVGAMGLTVKAGSAAGALSNSRWFVPLVGTSAGGDAVQLVAFTDLTLKELDKIEHGVGTPEDKQRAAAVLVTQWFVTGGLTVLSVHGARNARALAGQPIEIIEQNGVKVARVLGESTSEPVLGPKPAPADTQHPSQGTTSKPRDEGGPVSTHPEHQGSMTGAHANASPQAPTSQSPEHWLAELEHRLTPDEKAKLAKMARGKTPKQVHDMLGADLESAHERVRSEIRGEQERTAIAAQSKERVAELRGQIAERGLMDDPDIRPIVEDTTERGASNRLSKLRDKLVAKLLRAEAEKAHPQAEVFDGVKLYEKLPEANRDAWNANHPQKKAEGLIQRDDGLYVQRGELDMLIIERQPSAKAKVIAREEIKTGIRDTNADAQEQLNDQTTLLRDGAAGTKAIRLEVGGRDITGEIDLGSDASASKSTRGPAGKGFDETLGISALDLEKMCKELLIEAAGEQSP